MLVIGGRITPAFSAGWLRMQGGDPGRVRIFPRLEHATLGTVLALFVLTLVDVGDILDPGASPWRRRWSTGARLAAWRGWLVRKDPLLWILHLSLLWIPVALLLLAAC
ncbi:MAG: NnrS family protein [Gammaproteobacteria bacterium]|nr:NnrS family protein [Gammaproteobacteria bacterium]